MALYGYTAYSASKYAVRGLAEVLDMEVKVHNIRVSVSFPPDTGQTGVQDTSADFQETWKFLHRRMEDANTFGKASMEVHTIRASNSGFKAPFVNSPHSPVCVCVCVCVCSQFQGLVSGGVETLSAGLNAVSFQPLGVLLYSCPKEDGKQRWKSVRQLQMAFAGRRPTRPSAVLKVDGEVTKTPEETKQRWYEHFNSILNIHSHFHQEVIDDIPSYPTMHDLDDPPTQGELVSVLGKLKKGKVGGETEIVAELILNGGQELRDRLKSLLQRVWREGTVVEDWKHAELVPIPKKGDLKHCDNWRGISLLDVVGKVFARVVQERLQIIAEKSLPESQCVFRKGRECTDMIFTARQLVEKCIEHNDSLFILFVDLKKAYDTVPRSALWCVGKVWSATNNAEDNTIFP